MTKTTNELGNELTAAAKLYDLPSFERILDECAELDEVILGALCDAACDAAPGFARLWDSADRAQAVALGILPGKIDRA